MYRLPDSKEPFDFPGDFVTTPDGLLAVGGNLHPVTLIHAYAKGIFPWFSESDPILWWYPVPRMVLFPGHIHLSRNMKKRISKTRFVGNSATTPFAEHESHQLRFNTAFVDVIHECADKRGPGRHSTWIVPEMLESYTRLHALGYAHSIEVVGRDGKLVGGLYGLILGKVFFGESMFSHEPDASKMALFALCEELQKQNFVMIDCQVATRHLESMGAVNVSGEEFQRLLKAGKTDKKEPLAGALGVSNCHQPSAC